MLLKDRSSTTRIELRRVQLLVNAHAQNPTKRLQDQGVVPSSIITELKRTQPCCPIPPPVQCPSITEIKILDIATLDGFTGYFLLNADTTIGACQTLTIPVGITLNAYGTTLTNNGTITVLGDLRAAHGYNDPPGQIINNNIINISSGGVTVAQNGLLNNTGIINNSSTITVQTRAILTNTGTINNNVGSNILINNAGINPTYINNTGKIYNLGTITNNNSGKIYNNSGGLVDNTNGTYTTTPVGSNAPGTFFNADGTLGCGTGQIIGTIPITGVTCPP